MWYIILILVLVYWCLWKIIKECNWSTFSRNWGTLNFIFFRRFFFNYQIYSTFIFWNLIIKILNKINQLVYYYYIWIINSEKKNFRKFFLYFFGSNILKGIFPLKEVKENLNMMSYTLKLYQDRYIKTWIYNKGTSSLYFYDRAHKFLYLKIQNFRDNLILEAIFASFPTIIISLIIAPSLLLLYSLDESINPLLNIKVIGHQWFWSYELENFNKELTQIKKQKKFFDSILLNENDLKKGQKRLLSVDKLLNIPINVPLRAIISSSDVLHAWAIPEIGIKVDAIPGRLNEFIFLLTRPGVFYGQCSELCGVGHGFMPIQVKGIIGL
jgi:heme/copper-type cytochrome/quinol oxidase subunit 2